MTVTFSMLEDLALAARAVEFDDLAKDADTEMLLNFGNRCGDATIIAATRYLASDDPREYAVFEYFRDRLYVISHILSERPDVDQTTREGLSHVLRNATGWKGAGE